MSTVITTTVKTEPTTDTLTFGAAGDSVAISGDSLNLNTLQDSGGNSLFVSNGSGTITSINSGLSGAMKLIQTQTASNATSVAFTSGIDSTYDAYLFKFKTLNPATDLVSFTFQVNASGQTGYNETMTTNVFRAYHAEDNGSSALEYQTEHDQPSGTSYQALAINMGNGSDECAVGEMYLFAPSNTTYDKSFFSVTNAYWSNNKTGELFVGGVIAVTSAITQIDFKMSSGNFDGTIAMYGISK